LTYSRSVLLAVIVGVLACLLLVRRQIKWRALLAPVLLLLCILVVQPDALFRFQKEDLHATQSRTVLNQGGARLEMWSTAVRMYLAHPITGVGQDNFLENYDEFAPASALDRYAMAHNDLLHIAATLGTLGLAAYIFFWVSMVLPLWSRRQDSRQAALVTAAGLAMIVGYLVMSQFEAFFFDEEVRLTLIFLLGLAYVNVKLMRPAADSVK
jgi:O-antigen ligase